MGRRLGATIAVVALALTAMSAFGVTELLPAQGAGLDLPADVIATGDLDRDGRLDLVVLTPTGKEVLVYLAADDAPTRLGPRMTQRFGQSLRRVAVGDLDGDGLPDLAAADAAAGGVWALLGRGDGTFRDPALIAVGTSPDAVAGADFDGRHGRDLAVADSRRGTVFVLLNDGASPPGFRQAAELQVGEHPEEVLAVDVNRDARPDVVTLNIGYARVQEVGVSRFRGMAGDVPQFEAVERVVAGEKPSQILAAELTGDGASELALLSRRAGEPDDILVVLLNDGTGRFSTTATPIRCPFFTGGAACRLFALAAADFDRNNRIDLAVALEDPRHPRGAPREVDAIQLLPGRGDGGFSFGPAFSVGEAPSALAAGNITGDCLPDLVAGSRREPTLQVLVNSFTPGLRFNGESCGRQDECVSGRCTDGRCCAVECGAGERCDLPGTEGLCRPVPPPLRPCTADRNCPDAEFPFCADGVCCNDPCPTGRCDRPGLEGLCILGSPPGTSCGDDRECESGFCSANFRCCLQRCEKGYCDEEGFCRPLGELTDICEVDEECRSGVCDTFDGICCNRRCEDLDGFCDAETGRCARSDAAGTGLAAGRRSLDDGNSCIADCDGDAAIAIAELIRVVALALGTGTSATCPGADPTTARCVSIDVIILAVKQALGGCASS